MAVASHLDVAVDLGRHSLSSAEAAQVEWWLAGAELVIVGRLGDVTALDQEAVRFVEASAVAEKVRRLGGDGASSITVAVDDANVTRRYENQMRSEDFTDAWWAMLGGSRKAVSMRVSGGALLR